jgi:hypothetical protein
MLHRPGACSGAGNTQETIMKALLILTASLALALAGCHRDDNSAASGGTSKNAGSMQTPQGGATGQASEGSTDDRNAPKRPASK